MWERAYTVSSFVVNCDNEVGPQNLKETLKVFDYTKKWMQALMDDQNITWNLLDLLADGWKDKNSSAPELLSLGSCNIHMIHDNYSTRQKCTDW